MAVARHFSMRVPLVNPTAADKQLTKTQLLEHSGSGLDHEHSGASGVRVGCVQLSRWVHSPRIGVLWRLNYSVKLHCEFERGQSIIFKKKIRFFGCRLE